LDEPALNVCERAIGASLLARLLDVAVRSDVERDNDDDDDIDIIDDFLFL
jgi:hypothetical protein